MSLYDRDYMHESRHEPVGAGTWWIALVLLLALLAYLLRFYVIPRSPHFVQERHPRHTRHHLL